jgi:alanyl-tRNA synthetase
MKATGVTSPELRQRFLEFFLGKGHVEVPPAPLVPKSDPSLLFTSAGMVQFKDYYMSPPPPTRRRAVTIQKCLRASDLDLVGASPRHHTFFEMLGNFSFGDYFKKEAILWAWEFIVSELGIPKERLWATVYTDDDEAREIWVNDVGLPQDKVSALGKEDNWWGPAGASGPCGPCSEMHYDMGPERGCGRPECAPGCDCDRFIEVWNLVFPQYFQDTAGNLTHLAAPGIDTGMGLERLAVVTQGAKTVYETDLLAPVVSAVRSMAPSVSAAPGAETALSVISDHVRGLVFAFAEGLLPSNEGRGYLIRRLLRRAVRRGFDVGFHAPFLFRMVEPVAEVMGKSPRYYSYLAERRDHIETVMRGEEERFFRTLEAGVGRFAEMASSLSSSSAKTFPGEWAFVLYDTYGFPPDMTREMAAEKGLAWDEEGLAAEMEKQRQRARRASTFDVEAGEAREWTTVAAGRDSVFTGYGSMSEKARVMRFRGGPAKDGVEIVLDRTPFYAESGGQVGDRGWLRWKDGAVKVTDTFWDGDSIVHRGSIVHDDAGGRPGGRRGEGGAEADAKREPAKTAGGAPAGKPDPAGQAVKQAALELPPEVEAQVDEERRRAIARNHTATHLLHAALRQILGDHVMQSGSYVAPERLRFDFSHYGPLKEDELDRVEQFVNQAVARNADVVTVETTVEEAQKGGAIALFDEKYGERVRQVTVTDVSSEVCGGTHVGASGEIGPFLITSQSAVGAGVRRIEALTGRAAWEWLNGERRVLRGLEEILGARGAEAMERARTLVSERDELAKAAASARDKDLAGLAGELVQRAEDVGGVNVVVAQVPPAAVPELRKMGDEIRKRLTAGVAVLATVWDEKVSFVAVVTDDLVKRDVIRADRLIAEVAKIAGGSGGGKPHLALAGAKDIGIVQKTLDSVKDIVRRAISV